MTIPLPPVPGPEITPRGLLTPPWHSWFSQLYTYLTQPSSGGGGIVPASRLISTTAPLAGGGDLSADRTHSIQANGITNALLAQMSASTLKGNNTGVPATALDLTVAQVTAMLNQFTTALQGMAPASGGGSVNFLRADGTWNTPPGPSTGGNPTALAGLSAVNGAATTFLRSDGAPAIDQTIAPTWTGQHTFSHAFGSGGPYTFLLAAAGAAGFGFQDTVAALDSKKWEFLVTGTDFIIRTGDDAGSAFKNILDATRSANVVTAVAFGNATDNPAYTFLGTGLASINGSLSVAGNEAITGIQTHAHLIAAAATQTSGHTTHYSRYAEIAAGITYEIGANADTEIT